MYLGEECPGLFVGTTGKLVRNLNLPDVWPEEEEGEREEERGREREKKGVILIALL